MSDALWRVSFRVPPALVEPARARLLELLPHGFEEAAAGVETELIAYVGDDRVAAVLALVPGGEVTAVEPGWEDAWRRFHRPVTAGGVWIGPPWEVAPADRPAVVVEPGRAFGTGSHATTRLCIEHLARLGRGSLLDVGCGSGVVALAAARLGYGPIVALDSDPLAVEITRDNAARNGVALEALRLDAVDDALPDAEVAVVNILRPVVERVLARLPAPVVVVSGYLAAEHVGAPGWRTLARLELDGWAADALAREPPQ